MDQAFLNSMTDEWQTALLQGDKGKAVRLATLFLKLSEMIVGPDNAVEDNTVEDTTEGTEANVEDPSFSAEAVDEELYISIDIQVESMRHTGISLTLMVNPFNMKISQLKEKVWTDWKIPVKLQRWIIGKMVPFDHDTLANHGVGTDDPEVFLYVMSPKAAAAQERLTRSESPTREGATATSERIPEPAKLFDVAQEILHDIQEDLPLQAKVGWVCPRCTLRNVPTRPGCELCSTDRPEDYVVPDDYQPTEREIEMQIRTDLEKDLVQEALEKERLEKEETAMRNFALFQEAYTKNMNEAQEEIQCAICMDEFPPGEAIMLRECLHTFCRECLAGHIEHSEEATIICPFQEDYSCEAVITEHEIRQLVTPEIYEKHLQRSVQQAETADPNSFHCKTLDCPGWCVYEDEVNEFPCPTCGKVNCLTCKDIHEGKNCQEYQDDMKRNAANDEAAKKTQEMLQELLDKKEAMRCAGCQVIVQKKYGCDWMKCSMCKTELCWATMGPRWGPRGNGDTTGGCKCGVNGRRCHPHCGNCH